MSSARNTCWRSSALGRTGVLIAGAGVAAIPLFGNQFVAFVFALGVVYGIIGLSLSVLTGWVGQASLGHAAFAGVGAFTAAELQQRGWPFGTVFPVVVVAAVLASLVVGLPALRVRGLQLAVATLAFGWMAERAVFSEIASQWDNKQVRRPDFLGVSFLDDRNYYLLCLLVAVVVTLFVRNLRSKPTGRGLAAVRESELVFSHVGGNVAAYKLLGFCLSAAIGAVGGVLYGGLNSQINARLFNLQFSFLLLAIAIVGGMGSLLGPYVAGLAFAWYPQLFAGIETLQYWTFFIGGVSMIIFVLALPGGLVALPERIHALATIVVGARHRRRRENQADLPDEPQQAELDLRGPPEVAVRSGAGVAGAGLAPVATTNGAATGRTRRRRHDRWEAGDTILRLDSVCVRFGGTIALSDVTMDVAPGEIHGLVGPNGAGKSTVFNCITGVLNPHSGDIVYQDASLLGLPAHRRVRLGIARTFQSTHVLPGVSVLENLMIAEQAHRGTNVFRDGIGLGLGRDADLRKTAEAKLEFLGLLSLRDVVAHELPHGTLKLVELGRALTAEPDLLLLDEPAAGLNMDESLRLGAVLRQLRDETHLTVLVVEHDMALIMGNCDRVTVLDYGRVLASGRPDALRNDPTVVAAYLGTTYEELLANDAVG